MWCKIVPDSWAPIDLEYNRRGSLKTKSVRKQEIDKILYGAKLFRSVPNSSSGHIFIKIRADFSQKSGRISPNARISRFAQIHPGDLGTLVPDAGALVKTVPTLRGAPNDL